MKTLLLFLILNLALLRAEYGLDVSVWQGSINWSDVRREKSFAFIRSSYGVTEDSRFSQNWPNAKATGMSVGPYHYFEPGDDPTSQAERFCGIVGSLQNLPPVLDCEVSGGLSAYEYQQRVLTWLKYVESHFGRKPMIYTAPYFGDSYLNSDELAQYPLWVANYGVSSPSMPGKWSSYQYWQYSDSGSVSGIGGTSVDLDKTP